jgi:hypothetical protein
LYIDLTEAAGFLDGVHAIIEHLRTSGLTTSPMGRWVLPLVFDRDIELDTFVIERIFHRNVDARMDRSDITSESIQLVKSEDHTALQRALRARTSTYMSQPDATAEGLADLRTIDADVARRERELRERTALVLRDFGFGFGLSNGHLIDVIRWYTRLAMHYLTCTLAATRSPTVTTMRRFTAALKSLPAFHPDPESEAWWKVNDPAKVRVHHKDSAGRYHTTATVIVPKRSLCVRQDEFENYPGVPLQGAFEYEALTNYVLPQMIHRTGPAGSSSPAAWDEDNFRIWQQSD